MQQNITGLYLNHISYGDTSVIVRLYTKEYGTVSFIVKGIKRKKGGLALLQPFHYIELTSNFKPDRELNFGNKVKLFKPTQSITSDIRKTTVAIFLTEVLAKTLQESAPNESLYEKLEYLITYFDTEDFSPIFHHLFLVQLIKELGIMPNFGKNQSIDLFNLETGLFERVNQPQKIHFTHEESLAFKTILGTNFANETALRIANSVKKNLLKKMVQYIEVQTEIPVGSIRSIEVLESVFNR